MRHALEHAVVHSDRPVIEDLMQAAVVGRSALRVQIHDEIAGISLDPFEPCDTSVIRLGEPCPSVDALRFRVKDRIAVLRAALLRQTAVEHLLAGNVARLRPQLADITHDELPGQSQHFLDIG